MRTDQEILAEGFRTIFESLGMIDAERFISLISRERFDYTEWQRHLWEDDPLETIYQRAVAWALVQYNSKLSQKYDITPCQ